ncbi:TonB-dependent receptor [Roseateles sp. NT4]|uniref:TonB-dependent receptor n=1 Tax=Roseateles sp. NT4 TaxID=3453715 RepID=UPI003EEF44E3
MTATSRIRLASRQRRCPATPIATAVGIALLTLGSAQAQTAAADKPADANQLETVVVTGYRSSIEKSLDRKRNSDAIVDVISAEDVGKFPDKNVADALQRVPGVIINRDGGEGKNVSVRGLSSALTLTELNGNYIATAESNGDPTRSFNYTLMPSNMLGSAELFKTPEARLDEGGVGGTVILRTRRPLDQKSGTGFVSAEGTTADTTGKVDGQFSGQYSWHDEGSRLGVLVGLTSQKRTSRGMSTGTESWTWYGRDEGGSAVDVNGNATPGAPGSYWGGTGFYDQNGNYYTHFAMPNVTSFSIKEEERKRTGAQLTVQFKPVDSLTLTGNYFRFDLSQNSQTNTLKIPEWSIAHFNGDGNWKGGRMLDSLTFDPSHTIVTGAAYSVHPGKAYYCNEAQAAAAGKQPGGWGSDDCAMPLPQITGSYNREKAKSQTADFEADWRGQSLDATFKIGRTKAEGTPQQWRVSMKPRRQNADGSYSLGNTVAAYNTVGTPTATFAPDLLDKLRAGIGEIDTGSTDSSWTRNSNYQNYGQADFTWHLESNWLDSVQFGFKQRNGGVHRATGNNYWVCAGANPSDYAKRYQAGCDPNAGKFLPEYVYAQSLDKIKGGFNANIFPGIDYASYINHLNTTYGAMQTRDEPNFVYNVDEKISAAYVQANIRTDRLRGNVGLRLVRTKQHADSTDQVDYYNAYFWRVNGVLQPCNGAPAAGAPAGSGCQGGFTTLPDDTNNPNSGHTSSFVVTSLDRTYTDALPSFNLAYDLSKDLVLRAAASKVISRPGYGDIASPGGLTSCAQQYVTDHQIIGGGCDLGWTGSGSNKKLEPYKATQFDLGLEWYFHRGSVLGFNAFRKNVKNFTVPVIQDVSMAVGGQTVTVKNYSTTAGGRNGVSQGVELFAQHTLDFGLGFQFNYTANHTNNAEITLEDGTKLGKSPLVGSAKNQANLTVFYETDQYLLRASYNRRGEVVNGKVSGLFLYDEPYSQIDLNAGYNITKQLSVTASVLNVTRQVARQHLGDDTKARFYGNNYDGRIVYVGANYKF